MAQYYDWADAEFAEVSSVDVDATAVADAASLTTDAVSLDGYTGAEVMVTTVEDNTGACDDNVYVYVLGLGATGYETIDDAPALAAVIDQVQNTTRHAHFAIDAAEYSSFKILVFNDCGQEVAVSIKVALAQLGAT